MNAKMTRKSVLITGCSTGIGYDAAHALQKRGWRVFATCRKPADCDRLIGEGLESFLLDYQDEHSIQIAVDEVLARTGGTLDAIFNNGAYATPGAVEDLSRDALRDIFETNLFGQIDLTNRFIPVMRAQGYGRVVFNSSVLGFTTTPFRGAYSATKYAMEALVDAYRMEFIDSDLEFILIEPGPIESHFRKNAAIQFEKWIDVESSPRRDFYHSKVRQRLYDESGNKGTFELGAEAVSAKLVHALESRKPHARYFVTTPTYIANLMRRLLPTRLLDKILSRQ